MSKADWQNELAERLRTTQTRLAHEVQTRDLSLFRPLAVGKAGAGGMYDVARRLKAWARGERFRAEHES